MPKSWELSIEEGIIKGLKEAHRSSTKQFTWHYYSPATGHLKFKAIAGKENIIEVEAPDA